MIPKLADQPSFIATALFFKVSKFVASNAEVLSNLLSMMPVSDTPSNASSSVLVFQAFVKYLKLVKVAWKVPKIVASSTLFESVDQLSLDLTTTSVRLQNCLLRNMISLQGLQPKSL